MSKVKLSVGKHSLVRILSLGVLVIGVSCIAYALFNIWPQSGYSINDTNSGNANLKVAAAELNKLKNSNEPLELDSSNVLSSTDKPIYDVYPEVGDNIGSLTIPAINRKVPIIQGTGVKELKKGVGHFIQSVLPGEKDNCVISGHRDTALRQVGNLKTGDELILKTSAGTFTYKISGTRIVHENDKTVIVPMDHAVLTLTTCYPFNFIGSAPDRYIISADLVKTSKI